MSSSKKGLRRELDYIALKTGGATSWLYNPVSSLPYGNGNEFFYLDGTEWVKPTNEIEVELECRPGIMNYLYIM